jgi:LCP family protein required for cell wall assembly
MKRGIWIAIAVGIVFILVGVVVILMFVPLGPPLSVASPTHTTAGAETGSGHTATATAKPTDTPAVASITPSANACGSGVMSFLALGESLPPRGTDAIRLVRVDFDNNRNDVLALPSELWVSTPSLYESGISGATLNEVYLQGKSLASGDEQARMLAGVNLFVSTLQANFGYIPDHYFFVKQSAFSEIVDALNGVDVVLPQAVDGRATGLGYFPAGAQHLTGAMALDLVRINSAGEWARFDQQNLFIQAIYQSILTPKNWDRLPALIQAFRNNVFTDLSVKQILDVVCILNQAGVVVNQHEVGPSQVLFSGENMLPIPELGQYILETVGT